MPGSLHEQPADEPSSTSNLDLLRYGQSIIHLDPEKPDGALEFGMPEEEVDRTKVARPTMNYRNLVQRIECVPYVGRRRARPPSVAEGRLDITIGSDSGCSVRIRLH